MKKVDVKRSYYVARAMRGLNNIEVAGLMGINESTLSSRIGSGNNIQVGKLIPIADALGFSLSEFIALGEK